MSTPTISQLVKSLEQDLVAVIADQYRQKLSVKLSYPKDLVHGDFTTNVALSLFSRLKGSEYRDESPLAVAQKLVIVLKEGLKEKKSGLSDSVIWIDRVSAEQPGFINFWLTNTYLHQLNSSISSGTDVGRYLSNNLRGKKVIVEFTDPNPFKEFHIGHLYSNIVGEAICRLQEAVGAQVKRACYQGDVGMHVAKSLWGMWQKKEQIAELSSQPLNKKAQLLGQAYALGASVYETDAGAKQAIQTINQIVYENLDLGQAASTPVEQNTELNPTEIMELYHLGRRWSLEYFAWLYNRLGMKFDYFFFESQVGREGVAIVKEYLTKGVFETSQGAIIFPGSKHGLHDRVFINSLGLPTYEAKELGLAPTKYAQYAYDRSIIITGNEIDEYFKVLLKAMSLTHPDLAEKTTHLSHGMVKLPEGKMSSRTGKVITGEWLMNQATEQMVDRLRSTRPELNAIKQAKIGSEIALGAIKYALLKSNIGGDVIFSFEQSLAFSGNSGPYLQYTAVRCMGVLRKATAALQLSSISILIDLLKDIKVDNDQLEAKTSYTSLDKELLRFIARYFDTVEMAAEKYAPHSLTEYLYELAQKLNYWYDKQKIIELESGQLTQSAQLKLSLALTAYQVLFHGLSILGINIPEEM
ncbi:MAG TPA: arginine--tRNA ligase [Candidatus Woesebacteria bacterium]|nr:arginine--tRNA ligase [Candidatus Woesebacteria bacterium]